MSDDLDLAERFEPLAAAPFAPVTETAVLRARVASRRRRRRALVAGGIAAAVAVVGGLGVLAALAVPDDDGPVDELRTVAPTEEEGSSVPASYGTGPRLVVGAVPAGLSSDGCGPQRFGDGETASCLLGVPTTDLDDGLIIVMRPAAPDVAAAWAAADAAALARLHGRGTASFATLGGRDVLDLGEYRMPGRIGRPDRVYRSYEVLAGDSVISVQAENVTDEQLDQVVRGLGVVPSDLGFATSVDALPAEARAIAQGQERLWYQPASDPSRSDDNGGEAAGITYAIGDEWRPLQLHVVRGVDAESYLDAWASQQDATDTTVEPVSTNGRSGHLAREERATEGSTGELVALAVDEGTVIIVEGATTYHESILAIAGRTRVAESAPEPDPATTVPDPGGTVEGPGWYLPGGLPEGWILDRASIQATDGSGEAQLWLTSPSGNVLVVTLKVPRSGYGPSSGAEEHRLPGSSPPIYVDPIGDGKGGAPFRYLTTTRPDAFIDVVLLGGPSGEEATPAGDDETDELAAALVPATTDRWRAALAEVPAPPVLLEASSLEDLPDRT